MLDIARWKRLISSKRAGGKNIVPKFGNPELGGVTRTRSSGTGATGTKRASACWIPARAAEPGAEGGPMSSLSAEYIPRMHASAISSDDRVCRCVHRSTAKRPRSNNGSNTAAQYAEYQ